MRRSLSVLGSFGSKTKETTTIERQANELERYPRSDRHGSCWHVKEDSCNLLLLVPFSF